MTHFLIGLILGIAIGGYGMWYFVKLDKQDPHP